jgi:hypothetical protein
MHASIEYELSDKPYHENEWLELCVYYDHYGTTPQLRDPMIGITFDAAIEIDINKEIVKKVLELSKKHNTKL